MLPRPAIRRLARTGTGTGTGAGGRPAHGSAVDAWAVGVLALLVRSAATAAGPGGFTGDLGYDGSVYYTAADALLAGRTPYRDFLFLHPPAVLVVLAPFAALGRLTTDHLGFVAAAQGFALIGALNAALVVRTARRIGLSRASALAGGAFYAVWNGAILTEVAPRLEPLGTCAFLGGLLLLSRSARPRALVVAGAVLGLAVAVKVWWIVPVAIVIAWPVPGPAHGPARPPARRRLALLVGGAGTALVLVLGPFFAAAPGAMWRMVVSDQLGRQNRSQGGTQRLVDLMSLRLGDSVAADFLPVVVLVGLAVLALAAWRVRTARVLPVVALAQLAVLLVAPSYFAFYAGYLAGPLSLVVAAGAQGLGRRAARPAGRTGGVGAVRVVAGGVGGLVAGGVLAVVAAGTATAVVSGRAVDTRRLPSAPLARAVAGTHCLVADSPMALIAADTLSRDLDRGCPNWVDVSGRTYDVDAPPGPVRRVDNPAWQADVSRYLRSGDAVVLIRPATGLSPRTRRAVTSGPVLVRLPGLVVHRVAQRVAR